MMIKLANNSTDISAGYKSKINDLNNQLTLIGVKKIDFFNFMHYSHDFNHFHIHPLYHRYYLQCSPSIKLSQFIGSYMSAFENHWHSLPLHILLYLHPISYITTSGSDILSNSSFPSITSIHVPLGCCYPFLVQNIFSIHIF